ncbi:MAG: DMT family transporter [Solirubrobacterales bacterium]|nr:DMT family transporter [Solirubrobacterales bacterium]
MPSFLPSLTAVLCWGAMFPIADSALQRVDAAHITAIRYGSAALVFLGLLAAVEGRRALRYEGRFGRAFVLGTAGFAGFNLLSFAGLPHTTPQHAALIVATMPLITVLARWRMTGERPATRLLACVGVALLGVALVITDGDPAAAVHGGAGDVLVLAAAVCWVRYTLGAAEVPDWSPLRYTALSAAAGTLSIIAIAIAGDVTGVLTAPSADDVAAVAPQLAYVVVFGAVLGVLGWNAGVRRLGPANAALFMNLVPVTTFAIEAFRGAEPAPVELLGAGIAMAALVAANVAGRAPVRRPALTRAA